MIPVGASAPPFGLATQFNGGRWRLGDRRGRSNVLILGYPLDFTPICSSELPELNRLADDFQRLADTEVVSLNADSWQTHLGWSNAMREPIRFPMLADTNPGHGAVCRALGLWIPAEEITQRGTIIIDKNGVVRFTQVSGKDNELGRRVMTDLLRKCVEINGGMKPGMSMPAAQTEPAACSVDNKAGCDLPPPPAGRAAAKPAGQVAPKATLFVLSHCGHCATLKRKIAGRDWARVADMVEADTPEGGRLIAQIAPGLRQAPALVVKGEPVYVGVPDVYERLERLMGGR